MVPISQKIYALKEVWDMNFNKFPLASFYHEYPFLIFENLVSKEECKRIIDSLEDDNYRAKLIGKGLDEEIRKTIIHKPTPKIKEFFYKIFEKVKKETEDFFGVSFLKGSEIQILEYKEGGFYKCHADNASEIYKNGVLVGYKEVVNRKLTTLFFLNDDFRGGEIEFCHLRFFDGKKVIFKPKAGMMIVFPSHGLFAHEVKKVKGRRFTIVKWWEVI